MPSRLKSTVRLIAAIALSGAMPASSSAQTAQSSLPPAPQPAQTAPQPLTFQDYSKPRAAFPHVLAPYQPQQVDPARSPQHIADQPTAAGRKAHALHG